MLSRRVSLVVAGLVLAGLTGCTPTPAPTPTPTGFASEDEAFAAAEELYRAHVADLNAYYAGDRDYDSEDYLSGVPLQDEQNLLAQMDELDLKVDGELIVRSVDPQTATLTAGSAAITLITCLDSSQTRILDAEGNDVTPEREEVLPFDVEIATVDSSRLAIVSTTVNETHSC
ncbi:hypothetical protein B5M43_004230 [Microbacterium sp. MEC084]|uniref:hypothetical protein n=1 Tax=Microbacterium sp. MEC084 TaxID=1963027 RepID=UPI00106F112D|nr:hypothetical protein [Microbacterium sp. MEC084]MCD1268056.1 hypothetical protein [Microbacterium sp. MEC084]